MNEQLTQEDFEKIVDLIFYRNLSLGEQLRQEENTFKTLQKGKDVGIDMPEKIFTDAKARMADLKSEMVKLSAFLQRVQAAWPASTEVQNGTKLR